MLRDVTERPEAVEAGAVRLVGRELRRVTEAAAELLTDDEAYRAMSAAVNPYGDGQAAARIVRAIRGFLARTEG